eukprot:TRINITY_DN65853_c0_g1_i1.p1 TRINITY_DN65853_c0_g1~~TRINITY_DN65853_c0_g1_i1.p1  ORF type:complete len:652 (+),score=181.78 TRINITY_DN65853_c0_g1_i1:116-1957(+)
MADAWKGGSGWGGGWGGKGYGGPPPPQAKGYWYPPPPGKGGAPPPPYGPPGSPPPGAGAPGAPPPPPPPPAGQPGQPPLAGKGPWAPQEWPNAGGPPPAYKGGKGGPPGKGSSGVGVETLVGFQADKSELGLLDIVQRHRHHHIPETLLKIRLGWPVKPGNDFPAEGTLAVAETDGDAVKSTDQDTDVAAEGAAERVAVVLLLPDSDKGRIIASRMRMAVVARSGVDYLIGGAVTSADGRGQPAWAKAAMRHVKRLTGADLSVVKQWSHFADFVYRENNGAGERVTHVMLPHTWECTAELPTLRRVVRTTMEEYDEEVSCQTVSNTLEEVHLEVDIPDSVPPAKRRRVVSKFIQRSVPTVVTERRKGTREKLEEIFTSRAVPLSQLVEKRGEPTKASFELGACADLALCSLARRCGDKVLQLLRQGVQRRNLQQEATKQVEAELKQKRDEKAAKLKEIGEEVNLEGGLTSDEKKAKTAELAAGINKQYGIDEKTIRETVEEKVMGALRTPGADTHDKQMDQDQAQAFSIADPAADGKLSGNFARQKMDAVLGAIEKLSDKELVDLYDVVPRARGMGYGVFRYADFAVQYVKKAEKPAGETTPPPPPPQQSGAE